jgi:predicted dithiol-disulfide oxidoreductase (DUF899 family)
MSTSHPIVSREQWLAERVKLLKDEKAFTQMKDALAERRQHLPWVKVEQDYVFDGPEGPVALADMFGKNSQLLVYHFMFAPEWSQGCKSCSFVADSFNSSVIHLQHRDTALVAVSRAPIDKLLAFRDRMGWSFPWVSSGKNTFNHDFGVYFNAQERSSGLSIYNYVSSPLPISDLPGMSAFSRDEDGNIYHTYSTYARGLDIFLNVYNLLDVTAKGRDEEGMTNMDWLRHHDRYGVPGFIDPWMEPAALIAAEV